MTQAPDDERRDDNKGHPLFDRRSPDARNHSYHSSVGTKVQ